MGIAKALREQITPGMPAAMIEEIEGQIAELEGQSGDDTLWASAETYMRAYDVLANSREYAIGGMGGVIPQPIKVSEIIAYGQQMGIADCITELEELIYFVQLLDGDQRDQIMAQQKK